MKSILFMPSLVAAAVVIAPACSANPLSVGSEIEGGGPVACASAGAPCVVDASAGRTADARPSDKDGGSDGSGGACESAGGTCVQAVVACTQNAPSGAQDCSGGPNPAGAHCCLTLSDAGSDGDAAAGDAAPGHDDGGNSDGGPGAACAAAGGTCIGPNTNCAIGNYPPAAAQDCQPPMGFFCCLLASRDN